MKSHPQDRVVFDALESRTLLSASHFPFGGGRGWHDIANQDPAVQADLLKIQQDKQQLATDRAALQQVLADDRQAIHDAIKALDTQLAPLRQTLKDDTSTWWTTIKTDLKSIWQARGDATAVAAAKAQLKTDLADARTALKADADAIQAVIDADPTVTAAKQKLQTDQQPITDDLALIKTDTDQLRADLKAAKGAGSTSTT